MNSLGGTDPRSYVTNRFNIDKFQARGKPSLSAPSSRNNKIPHGFKEYRINQYTPEQQSVFKDYASRLGPDSYLSRLAAGDEDLLEESEAPALRQFNALQGNIASRFSRAGLGARNSSAFRNQTSAAASNFAQDLQARRQDLMRNAYRDLAEMSNQFLNQRPYETGLAEKEQHRPSTASQFGTAALNAIGSLGSGFFGG